MAPKGKSVASMIICKCASQASSRFRNQATFTIAAAGSSASMRHTDRMQRVSFRWLEQQFDVDHFNMINVDTVEQAASIFTKPFVDRPKRSNALLRLINHFGYAGSVVTAAVQDADGVSGVTHDRQPALPAKGHSQAVESFATERLK